MITATSIFLARFFGFYLLIKIAAVWANRARMQSIVDGFKQNDALRLSASLITAILGLLFVLIHNVWASNWAVLITIVSWLFLIKGIALSMPGLFPEKLWAISTNKSLLFIASAVSLVLSAIMLYHGFNF